MKSRGCVGTRRYVLGRNRWGKEGQRRRHRKRVDKEGEAGCRHPYLSPSMASWKTRCEMGSSSSPRSTSRPLIFTPPTASSSPSVGAYSTGPGDGRSLTRCEDVRQGDDVCPQTDAPPPEPLPLARLPRDCWLQPTSCEAAGVRLALPATVRGGVSPIEGVGGKTAGLLAPLGSSPLRRGGDRSLCDELGGGGSADETFAAAATARASSSSAAAAAARSALRWLLGDRLAFSLTLRDIVRGGVCAVLMRGEAGAPSVDAIPTLLWLFL